VPVNRNGAVVQDKGHKRANTFGSVFGRSGSLFGGKPQSPTDATRPERRHPPTSMKAPIAADEPKPRTSTEQRRPSVGYNRKNSDVSKPEREQKSRRFSLLPASFSLKAMTPSSKGDNRQSDSRPGTQPTNYTYTVTTSPEARRNDPNRDHSRHVSAPVKAHDRQTRSAPHQDSTQYPPSWRPGDPGTAYPYGEPAPTESNNSFAQDQTYSQVPGRQPTGKARYPQGFNEYDQEPQPRPSMQARTGRVLHKPNRKFAEAWDRENEANQHAASTGAARRVMDFFRRRGKARAGDDR
jgi:protein-serine/threonine kinase